MKHFAKHLIKIFILLLCVQTLHSQKVVRVQVEDASGDPVTGLTGSNIVFRISPFGAGNTISGLTVTETGSRGNYVITGFTTFQEAQLWIDGVKQLWFESQFVGDPTITFGKLASSNTWSGTTNDFNGVVIIDKPYIDATSPLYTDYGHAEFYNSTLVWKKYLEDLYGRLGSSNTWTGATNQFEAGLFHDVVTFEDVVTGSDYQMETASDLYLGVTQPSDPNLIWKKYAEANYRGFPLNGNRIIVDSKQTTDVAGKIYNEIKEAVDYIQASGAPGANNRWIIFIIGNHASGYTTNFTWYDYIDIVGLGHVTIKNTTNEPPYSIFLRSGAMTDRNVRAVNLNFEQTDANITFEKMILKGCSVRTIEDNYTPILTINGSQVSNCSFSIGSGLSFVTSGVNSIIDCISNKTVSFGSSDVVVGWEYNTSLTIQQ